MGGCRQRRQRASGEAAGIAASQYQPEQEQERSETSSGEGNDPGRTFVHPRRLSNLRSDSLL